MIQKKIIISKLKGYFYDSNNVKVCDVKKISIFIVLILFHHKIWINKIKG